MADWLVVASSLAPSGERAPYEDELDHLHLTDHERRKILEKAGLR